MRILKLIPVYTLLFLFTCVKLSAQTEFIIPWQNNYSVWAASHCTDKDGNVYILGYVMEFIKSSSFSEDRTIYGNTVFKVDNNNNVVWKNLYETISAVGEHYFPVGDNPSPAYHIFHTGNNLFIPYTIHIGTDTCSQNSHGFGIQASNRNAGMYLSANSGDITTNRYFDRTFTCGISSILYAHSSNTKEITYLYWGPRKDTLFEMVRDSNLEFISKRFVPIFNFREIVYDTFSNNYFVGAEKNIYIYSKKWQLLSTVPLPTPDSTVYPSFKFSFNRDYFVVHYYIENSSPKHFSYTVVFSRNQKMVSCKKSPYYSDIIITDQNELIGVSSLPLYYQNDLVKKPIVIYQSDLMQNLEYQKQIGLPFSIANKITQINKNEIVITGTSYTTVPNNYPNQTPNSIYYYRDSFKTVDHIANNKNKCNSISFYPNPVDDILYINNTDFNVNNSPTLKIFNCLGQKVYSSVLDMEFSTIDIINYPSGTYFINTSNSSSTCTVKIMKK